MNIRFPPQNVTDLSFVVQWDASINQSVDRYTVSVYRTDDDDDRNLIQIVTVNETSCTITGLTPNTTYTVNVASVDESDCTGVPSTGKKVNTTLLISMDTTSTFPSTTPSASLNR